MNIATLVRYWATWRPDHPAIIHNETRLSWRALDQRSDALARGLRAAGVGKGDRLGGLLTNRIELPLLIIATLKLGAIFVPLNFRLTGVELLPLLEDAECRLVVTEAAHLAQLEPASRSLSFAIHALDCNDARPYDDLVIADGPVPTEEIAATDPAFICYTSGTTGQQKGALLTHLSAIYPGMAKNIAEGLTWRDSIMVAVPLVFTGAVISCFIQFTVNAGGTMVLESDFNIDRYLGVIERHRVSAATTVPVVWERLARSPEFARTDISSMISAACGGAPVSLDLIETYRRKGISLIQSYGLTEASGLVATMHGEDAMHHIGWAGRAIMGTEIRIADHDLNTVPLGETGEILVKGPHVMQGYWRKPEATAQTIVDGWLRTGDLGMMNAEGFVRIVDRSKDMLISGGINVYPAEIENALAGVEGLADYAVIGVPDAEWGEVPMLVAANGGDHAALCEAIERVGRPALARFKQPKHLVLLGEALPRTLSGKISKPALRQRFPKVPEGALRLFAR
ncbi:MAG: AMP-binding protein [Sphingomonadales bacterium]|nr:AMP-binding protein [Sphingomonadales bacterium]